MKRFLLSVLKRLLYGNSSPDVLLNKIEALEKRIEEIKLQVNDVQAVRIEKIIVEKIICEKIETSYKIDSINNENLSGTMNIGTIFPGTGQENLYKEAEEPSIPPETEKPKVNIIYGTNR